MATVKDNGGRDVEAKVVTDAHGMPVNSGYGRTMLGPRDYDPKQFANAIQKAVETGETTATKSMMDFRANAPNDLQRNYNGKKALGGPGFVKEFTPVASYALG